MSGSGPDRCPWCEYDLKGLPPPHRCPECGTEYDEHTRIWRASYSRVLWIPLLIAAYLSGLQLLLLVFNVVRGDPVRTLSVLSLLLTVAIAIYIGLLIRRVRWQRWLAITPRGLVIRYALGPELIPWANLTDVTPSLYRRQVFIHRRSRGPFKERVEGILKHGDEVTKFVTAVREAKRRYASSATGG